MTLDEELKAMEDVRQLKARYFRTLDTKDWANFALIFCRDASFDLRQAATTDPDGDSPEAAETGQLVLNGRDAIAGTIRDMVGTNVTVHHGHCHEVWIDSPEEARGIIAMVDIIRNSATGELILEGYGHYHETYRREQGEWRIWRSRLSRLWVTSNLFAR